MKYNKTVLGARLKWTRKPLVLVLKIWNFIFPSDNRSRIKYFAVSILMGHLFAYVFIQQSLSDGGRSTNDGISVVDVEVFHTKAPIIQKYLEKSYIPLRLAQSLFPNETETCNRGDALSNSVDSGRVGASDAHSHLIGAGASDVLYTHLNGQHDPRLLVAMWLDSIHTSLSQGQLDPHLTVPFSWASMADMKPRLHSSSYQHQLDCKQFGELYKIPLANLTTACQDLKSAPKAYPKLKFTKPPSYYTSVEASRIIGSSHLLHAAPKPDRVVLMGLGPSDRALVVPVSKNTPGENAYNREELSQLIYQFVLNNVPALSTNSSNSSSLCPFLYNGVSLSEQVHSIKRMWSKSDGQSSFIPDDKLTRDIFRISNSLTQTTLNLTKSHFQFDLQEYMSKVQNDYTKSYQDFHINELDRKLLKSVPCSLKNQDHSASIPTKYFHETKIWGTTRGAHFDWRFFKGVHFSNYETQAILHRLSRAWLRFANNAGLNSWLAHGSLLGWYWNGLNMPWDQDVDVQITMESLVKLARNYNQTLVVDLFANNHYNQGLGSYLVDVGPGFHLRDKGDGANVIDARFIDIETGFYVDITGLASTNAAEKISVQHKDSVELNQLLDPQFLNKQGSHTVAQKELYNELYKSLVFMHRDTNLYNCKNNHFYSLQDLSPLIPTLFEGVLAYVPSNYKNILQREYRKGVLNYAYSGYRFRPMLDIWVPENICKKDYVGNKCFDQDALLETKFTRALTSIHRKEMDNRAVNPLTFTSEEELAPIRVDPWIIRRSEQIEKFIKSSIY